MKEDGEYRRMDAMQRGCTFDGSWLAFWTMVFLRDRVEEKKMIDGSTLFLFYSASNLASNTITRWWKDNCSGLFKYFYGFFFLLLLSNVTWWLILFLILRWNFVEWIYIFIEISRKGQWRTVFDSSLSVTFFRIYPRIYFGRFTTRYFRSAAVANVKRMRNFNASDLHSPLPLSRRPHVRKQSYIFNRSRENSLWYEPPCVPWIKRDSGEREGKKDAEGG